MSRGIYNELVDLVENAGEDEMVLVRPAYGGRKDDAGWLRIKSEGDIRRGKERSLQLTVYNEADDQHRLFFDRGAAAIQCIVANSWPA